MIHNRQNGESHAPRATADAIAVLLHCVQRTDDAPKHRRSSTTSRFPTTVSPTRRRRRGRHCEGDQDADANIQTSASSGSGVCGATSTRFVRSRRSAQRIERDPDSDMRWETGRQEGHPPSGTPCEGCCRRSPPGRQAPPGCPMPVSFFPPRIPFSRTTSLIAPRSTVKYNRRTRLGRGFTLAELKVRRAGFRGPLRDEE